MADGICRIKIGDRMVEYPAGTAYGRIIAEQLPDSKASVILVYANRKLNELHKVCREDTELEPIVIASNIGMAAYKRSVIFMMITAINKMSGQGERPAIKVQFSLGNGVFCTVGGVDITLGWIEELKNRMYEMAESDLPIIKHSANTGEVRKMFREQGQLDKDKLLRIRLSSDTRYYELDGEVDYYYGYMAPRTGMLKYFDIVPYDDGLVLQFPDANDPETVTEFKPMNKIYKAMRDVVDHTEGLGISDIGDLNEFITREGVREMILCQEAGQEKRIGDIAAAIAGDRNKKFVLIAGPSSSGKTSFANRLSIQLVTQGIVPHLMSADNYFVDRELTPRDENGDMDFESIHAVDLELLNQHLLQLMKGETVELPTFNFKKGKREYLGNTMHLGKDDVLIIEGIHCLNDEFTRDIPMDSKFRIFVSCLTTLNVDSHNRIPSTDNRLIRRMCRDARTRGTSAQATIGMWKSVRRGEEKNIFPYQENADEVFNSSLLYELAAEKVYCERLLHGIPEDAPEFQEAKRLLKFLGYMIPIESEDIPRNSLVREFIGGSLFNV